MKNLTQIRFISAGIFLLVASQAVAGWFGADFSADIYQGTMQNLTRQGAMSVSKGRVRTEMSREGEVLIEIIDPLKGKAWLLNPRGKAYLEREVPRTSAQEQQKLSPCDHLPREVMCQRVGTEPVNGRASDKWQLQMKGQTQLLWLDAEHHFPVRVVNDGQLAMEMRFLGRETVNLRQVEKWQAQMNGPQGMMSTTQWYDPQLNIAIRQVTPDGQLHELKNIRLGPQAENLFAVPPDYHLQQPQRMQNN